MAKPAKPTRKTPSTTPDRTYRSPSRTTPGADRVLHALGRRIRELRLAAGLTQEKTAHAAGVTFKHYQSIEGGKVNATVTTLTAIAGAIGVNVGALFADT